MLNGARTLVLASTVWLLFSGAGKLGNPKPLVGSLQELELPRMFCRASSVRIVSAGEIALAVAFLVPEAPFLKGFVILVFGAGLGALGAYAIRRKARQPCGCFGDSGGLPMGPLTLLAGGVFLLTGWVVMDLATSDAPPAAMTASAPLVVTGVLIAAALTWRRYIASAFPPRRSYEPAGGARA